MSGCPDAVSIASKEKEDGEKPVQGVGVNGQSENIAVSVKAYK